MTTTKEREEAITIASTLDFDHELMKILKLTQEVAIGQYKILINQSQGLCTHPYLEMEISYKGKLLENSLTHFTEFNHVMVKNKKIKKKKRKLEPGVDHNQQPKKK